MMRLLEVAGIPPLTDVVRRADDDNPGGYFEYERVKQLPAGDVAWLDGAAGHAVKVITTLLKHLPDDRSYDVIVLRRDLGEVVASQQTMLERRGQDVTSFDPAALADMLGRHADAVERWLDDAPNIRVLRVEHHSLLTVPDDSAKELSAFLHVPIDGDMVRSVVDPALYRNRKP
ncbi:MAG: uncharacterized protein JWN67_3682 [Actinomycetia bacterium]|nr:uncharacterized protein [Actinomycetes bacterium]